MCKDLKRASYVIPDSVTCWIEDFGQWLKDESDMIGFDISLPYNDTRLLDEYHIKWTQTTDTGMRALVNQDIQYVNGEMKFTKISAKLKGLKTISEWEVK